MYVCVNVSLYHSVTIAIVRTTLSLFFFSPKRCILNPDALDATENFLAPAIMALTIGKTERRGLEIEFLTRQFVHTKIRQQAASSDSTTMSTSSLQTVRFVVGNTYRKVPTGEQSLDRSGKHHKNHEWTLYVDILQGNPDIIERVSFDLPTFQPEQFVCNAPVAVKRPNGTAAWRFSTRQQSCGSVTATVKLRGAGGTVLVVSHGIFVNKATANNKLALQTFQETRTLNPLRMLPLPVGQKFGIELELTAPTGLQPARIASHIQGSAGGHVVCATDYTQGRQPVDSWKIVPDGSIVCSPHMPSCNTFEVVSPILQGGSGLQRVSAVVAALNSMQPPTQTNKSMGFHVHVDVSNLSVKQLIKVCQNFIKYEDVIDTFLPVSRRTGSPECDQYFRSNKAAVGRIDIVNNRQRHAALAACSDVGSVARVMNRGNSRYYKLNLQNLVTGRQPTMEFRQHSATVQYPKISSWIRFCVALVRNSARLAPPSAGSDGQSLEKQFDGLFQYVIKDRALRNFYRHRREHLQGGKEEEACCSGCSDGAPCRTKRRKVDN